MTQDTTVAATQPKLHTDGWKLDTNPYLRNLFIVADYQPSRPNRDSALHMSTAHHAVAEIHAPECYEPGEAEAIAHLFLAAPGLLAACKAMQAIFRKGTEATSDCEWAQTAADVDAAIAAAEGRA